MLKPTGFVPDEDMGSLMVDLSTPPGYTMAKTEEVMVRLTDQIQQLPEVESVGGVVGFGGANKGMVQVQLKPWAERKGNDHTSCSLLFCYLYYSTPRSPRELVPVKLARGCSLGW